MSELSPPAGTPLVDAAPFDPRQIERPAPALLRYYLLCAGATGPFFPLAVVPLLARYYTLRYRFDEEGIAMRWGVLFRREIHLTYRRIQDIHLHRNLVQRWFSLATVTVQTAAGSAQPEMQIEGVLAAEALRDYLYGRMRGISAGEATGDTSAGDAGTGDSGTGAASGPATSVAAPDEALQLLREIRDALQEAAEQRGQA